MFAYFCYGIGGVVLVSKWMCAVDGSGWMCASGGKWVCAVDVDG